uniref:Uncharacterized protein n=1 Tax=Timema shepardi TaxID=629360 RepID=A0A7R9B233_TIMSH|nr:unnamed protein product [Timema shepardi]
MIRSPKRKRDPKYSGVHITDCRSNQRKRDPKSSGVHSTDCPTNGNVIPKYSGVHSTDCPTNGNVILSTPESISLIVCPNNGNVILSTPESISLIVCPNNGNVILRTPESIALIVCPNNGNVILSTPESISLIVCPTDGNHHVLPPIPIILMYILRNEESTGMVPALECRKRGTYIHTIEVDIKKVIQGVDVPAFAWKQSDRGIIAVGTSEIEPDASPKKRSSGRGGTYKGGGVCVRRNPPVLLDDGFRVTFFRRSPTPPSDIAESEEIWQQLTEREHQTCSSLSNDIGAKWLLTCRREDPEISECIRRLFEHMFPALAVGIPEIGVKRFEPLYIKKLALTKGHGAVVISGSFTDILAHGPSNATTKYALFDLKNRIFELGIDIPEILVESEYDLSGKILILPLVGSGEARLRLCQYIRCQFWLSVSIAQWIDSLALQRHLGRPGIVPGTSGSVARSSDHSVQNTAIQVYVSFFLRVYVSFFLRVYVSFFLRVHVSFFLRAHVSFFLRVHVSFFLRVHVSFFLKVYVSFFLRVHVSFFLRGLRLLLPQGLRLLLPQGLRLLLPRGLRLLLPQGLRLLLPQGNTLNSFLNKNSQEVLNELKDPLSESLAEEFRDLMNSAYTHLPTDLWLLD